MEWRIYLVWLGAISFATFIVYGIDKAQAKAGRRRIPESVLHVMAVAGGFPGGWLGRSLFRHKTQRSFFFFILLGSTLLHAGLILLFIRLLL